MTKIREKIWIYQNGLNQSGPQWPLGKPTQKKDETIITNSENDHLRKVHTSDTFKGAPPPRQHAKNSPSTQNIDKDPCGVESD